MGDVKRLEATPNRDLLAMQSTPDNSLIKRQSHLDELVGAWVAGWFGTTLAGAFLGCVSGVFVGDVNIATAGLFFGGAFASVVGLLLFPTAATVAWIGCLAQGYRFWIPAAGAATGIVCVSFDPFGSLVAGALGALGAGMTTIWYVNNKAAFLPHSPATFQFTIGGLMARTAAVAVLLVVWKFLVGLLFPAL